MSVIHLVNAAKLHSLHLLLMILIQSVFHDHLFRVMLLSPHHTLSLLYSILTHPYPFLRRRPAAGGWMTEGDEPSNSDAMDTEQPAQPDPGPPVKQEPEANVTRERAVGSGTRACCLDSGSLWGGKLLTRCNLSWRRRTAT